MNKYPSQKNAEQKNTDNNTTDQAEENNTTGTKYRRRIQDAITSKTPTRKMNLDRRRLRSERRSTGDSDYKGPSRRYTIDRRLNIRDRRKAD